MPDFRQVDVKAITANSQRSDFSEEEINRLADAILENEGIIRPLVLKRSGIDSYNLIDGHLEYYAAVRAREKNPRLGEVVNTLIVNPKKEEAVEAQLSILNSVASPPSHASSLDKQPEGKPSDWITSFEVRLGDFRQELFQIRQAYDSRLKALEKRLEQQNSDNDLLELLNTLNADQLASSLRRYGVSKHNHVAKIICQAREKKETQHFNDYCDVLSSVKGLGEVTMLTMVEGWQRSRQSQF